MTRTRNSARLGALALAGILSTAGTLTLAGCAGDSTGLGVDLVSQQQIASMSDQAWAEITAQTPRSDNASYRRRADTVATRVLRAAGHDPAQWDVVVFEGEEVNAFALPGRHIGIYEGMMREADSDAELAAVIGHEIAHVEADHTVERVNSQAAAQLGVNLAAAVAGQENARLVAGLLGAGAQYGVLLPYGRNQELEADRIGLDHMARAGYDPRAALTFWQDMQANGGSRPPEFASTHPAPETRIAQIRQQLPGAQSLYRQQSRR